MNHNDSLQAIDTSNRETVGTAAPLPMAHLTLTDRFRLYDAACHARFSPLPAALGEWMLAVGLVQAPRAPRFSDPVGDLAE
jgi:hypothetical protein